MTYRIRARCAIVMIVAVLAAGLPAPTAAAGPLTGQHICIDPGHGGADPGAVNRATGLRESDINLDVSYLLKRLLEGDGATVTLARTDDSTRTNSDRWAFCNSQRATLVISMHTNSVVDPDVSGTLVLYYNDDDRNLAQAIYDELLPAMRAGTAGEPFTAFGIKRYRAAILRQSTMAGALVEPGFLSHPAEAERLAQPIYTDLARGVRSPGCADLTCRRGQIALAVRRGIVNYVSGAASDLPSADTGPLWQPGRQPPSFTPPPPPTPTATPTATPSRPAPRRPAESR
jgi:N-acetylmuramoyl-L-alanine amidase